MNSVILLAAGSGSRMQSVASDKILVPLGGLPVIAHSICAFAASGCVADFTIVFRDEAQKTALESAIAPVLPDATRVRWVLGGSERRDSVYNALKAQSPECEYVFIHDSARPFITPEAIRAVHAAVIRDGAAVLAHPVTDTIKRLPEPKNLCRADLEDLDRSRLWSMETPQAFSYSKILEAYRHASEHNLVVTDDAAAAATIGVKTTLVPNSTANPKLTTPADLEYAAWRVSQGR